MIERRLLSVIKQDLARKMVLLAGPRQCGKTTLAEEVGRISDSKWTYYNWDVDPDRKAILNRQLDTSSKLWIFDELHKYRHWKNFLKGAYDQHHQKHSIFVTGSARLDAYGKGGDSLQGRHYFHRLHPFTLSEVINQRIPNSLEEMMQVEKDVAISAQKTLEQLILLSGFPEPFLSDSKKEADRWRLSYGSHLVREEVRDLERIQDLGKMELLFDALPQKVGSVLSINNLREDLEIAFETARHWLLILENLYAIFRLSPFGAPRLKAVKKEQKLYFWDWARVENEGARFENLVALHLLRLTHWMEDVEGQKMELRYFRDINRHEVDFILLKKGIPYCAIEVKLSEQPLDKNLKYLLERVKIPFAFQIHLNGTKDYEPPSINGCQIRILPAYRFLGNLV